MTYHTFEFSHIFDKFEPAATVTCNRLRPSWNHIFLCEHRKYGCWTFLVAFVVFKTQTGSCSGQSQLYPKHLKSINHRIGHRLAQASLENRTASLWTYLSSLFSCESGAHYAGHFSPEPNVCIQTSRTSILHRFLPSLWGQESSHSRFSSKHHYGLITIGLSHSPRKSKIMGAGLSLHVYSLRLNIDECWRVAYESCGQLLNWDLLT